MAGRINFYGQYDGVLGTERRRLDLDRPLRATTRFVATGNATLAQIRDPATRV